MALNPFIPGVHHICLRCTDFVRTKHFYQDIIGFKCVLDSPELIAFLAGPILLAFKQAAPKHPEDKEFSPFNIGLDHIALICETEEELSSLAEGLKNSGVDNTGIKIDEVLQKQYVAFKDPDRIAWEFYMK